MERAQRGPSGKVSGPKGPCEPNEGAPSGSLARSQALLQPMRGLRGALVARSYSHVCFFIFHYTYATFIMPFTVLLTTRRGPFWAPGRGHSPFAPPGYAPARELVKLVKPRSAGRDMSSRLRLRNAGLLCMGGRAFGGADCGLCVARWGVVPPRRDVPSDRVCRLSRAPLGRRRRTPSGDGPADDRGHCPPIARPAPPLRAAPGGRRP